MERTDTESISLPSPDGEGLGVRLLIIRLSALGDVAMLVPVVKALASQYADLQITVLSMPLLRPVFESIGENVRFIEFDKKGKHKGIKGLNALYRQLKKEGFDAIADCHDVLRTKYLRLRFMMDGKTVSHIDKHRAGKRALTRQKDKILEQQPTSFENYAEAISKLPGLQGFRLPPQHPNIRTSEHPDTRTPEHPNIRKPEHPNIRKTEHPAPQAPSIGIAPFAAHQGKIYPLDKMLEVIGILLNEGKQIYLFGAGSKEQEVFKQWQKTYPQLIIAAEQAKGIQAELRLMSTLECMITMDSGNQHLAAIAGTRVVSVWGATHPYAGFLAWGQSPADCMQTDMPCRPCSIYGNKPCIHGTYPCMSGIKPEEIAEKALAGS